MQLQEKVNRAIQEALTDSSSVIVFEEHEKEESEVAASMLEDAGFVFDSLLGILRQPVKSYGISEDDGVTLCVKVLPMHKAKERIAKMQLGDAAELLEEIGYFVRPNDEDNLQCLVYRDEDLEDLAYLLEENQENGEGIGSCELFEVEN